jgi:hypothetical protein
VTGKWCVHERAAAEVAPFQLPVTLFCELKNGCLPLLRMRITDQPHGLGVGIPRRKIARGRVALKAIPERVVVGLTLLREWVYVRRPMSGRATGIVQGRRSSFRSTTAAPRHGFAASLGFGGGQV